MGKASMEVDRCRKICERGNCTSQRSGDDEAEIPSNIKGNHLHEDSKGSEGVKRAGHSGDVGSNALNV